MQSRTCTQCGIDFQAKTARKKTCSNACRMAKSNGRPAFNAPPESEDKIGKLEAAMAEGSEAELSALAAAIVPVEIANVGLSPLELRIMYGPTASLEALYSLRGLKPEAALLEFLEEE